jgi:hypothetical protein
VSGAACAVLTIRMAPPPENIVIDEIKILVLLAWMWLSSMWYGRRSVESLQSTPRRIRVPASSRSHGHSSCRRTTWSSGDGDDTHVVPQERQNQGRHRQGSRYLWRRDPGQPLADPPVTTLGHHMVGIVAQQGKACGEHRLHQCRLMCCHGQHVVTTAFTFDVFCGVPLSMCSVLDEYIPAASGRQTCDHVGEEAMSGTARTPLRSRRAGQPAGLVCISPESQATVHSSPTAPTPPLAALR